jgi:tRNA(Ile)-lysidine synthase
LLQEIRAGEFVRAGERVAVAVSGGADSVALLLLLLELRGKLGIVVSVAHFNHNLRGKASDADEAFVAKLAAKHGLAFHADRADVAGNANREKMNLEEAGRRTRYEFFGGLVEKGHADRVAVAHTADDQAETVLAHILRGTGLAGLGGIHPVAGHIFRPCLRLRRSDLRAYLRAKKQTWREDASNRDTLRTRARIRKKLIPLLEKEFQPAAVPHLVSLAELAREDEAWIDANVAQRTSALFQRKEGTARISVFDLLGRNPNEPGDSVSALTPQAYPSLSKRLIRGIVAELKQRPGQLNAEHIELVMNLAERGENGKSVRVPGGIEIRREKDRLIFTRTSDAREPSRGSTEYAYNIDFPADLAGSGLVLPVPYQGCVFRLSLIDWPPKRSETRAIRSVLDRDALQLPLVLRGWRAGDRFRPGGHRNAHKLKRLLNRERIARWDREGWPVLTSGGVLAWARGFPVAAEFAAGEGTRVGILIAEENVS